MIKIGQRLYCKYENEIVAETSCADIFRYEDEGDELYIAANNGIIRKMSEVENGTCELFTDIK